MHKGDFEKFSQKRGICVFHFCKFDVVPLCYVAYIPILLASEFILYAKLFIEIIYVELDLAWSDVI